MIEVKEKKIKLNRKQTKDFIKNLKGIVPNNKGGYRVKTTIPSSDHELFRTPTKGLYAWCYESELDGILKNGYGPIKFGQYGTDTENGMLPQDTVKSYNWSAGLSVVFLWVYPFTETDFKVGTPKEIEGIVNKNIGEQIKDGDSTEIFMTSIDIIETRLKQVLGKKNIIVPFISSDDKEEAINKMINNPTKYFGLFATMRHGKSWDYLEYIKRKYVKNDIFENHSIFCHDTKTYGGWKKKIEKSYSDCIDVIELKDNKDYDFSKAPNRNTIVLISPQLISASSNNEVITNFEEKLKSFKESYDIQVENIFVDEAHNYFTPQWEKYYESILKSGKTQRIFLASGTAANLILKHQDKFDETNTFIWGIKELKEKLLQELNIDLKLEVKLIQLKNTDGSDFNIANLQSEDDGVLSNQYHFEEFVNKMINPNSKFSPIFSRERKHHIALFDTVNSAKEFKRFVQSSKYSDKIVPILVAGSKGRDANSEQEVNKLILEAESQGKRTITLTCGSMIQGVSERNWKSILNLSSKSTYEIYFQLFGRGFEFDNDLDNYIGQETKEERVIMWDYNPHREYSVGQRLYNVLAEFVDSMAKVNGDDQIKPIKYLHDIIDITEFIEVDGAKGMWSEPKSYEEIESKINEIVNKNTIRRGLTVNTCLDKSFGIDELSSEWIEWAIKQKWSSNGKNGDKIRKQKLDLWEQNLLKQKTDHSKSQKDKIQRQTQKEILDLQEQVKRSFEQTLSKLDIVWAVYKAQGKVDYHIDELFKYYDEDDFLTLLGLPDKDVSRVFVETVKRFGLTDKINGKISKSTIETINSKLDLDKESFLTRMDKEDKMFTYDGDDTQLSGRDAYKIMKPYIKGLNRTTKRNLKSGKIKIHTPYAKSGSITQVITYLLKENFSELTNEEIVGMISYDDKKFSSLINTMGFSKTTKTNKDFIVINPPYKGGLHIEIFNKAFEELNDGGTLICLHPSTPFINRKPTKDDGKTQKIKEIVSKYKTRLTLINGHNIFDAMFWNPLSVTRVEKILDTKIEVVYSHIDSTNKEVIVYDKLDDIFIHGNDLVIQIYNKIKNKINKTINSNLTRNGHLDNYYLQIIGIGGNRPIKGTPHPDFNCIISKKYENNFDDIITKTFEKGDSNYLGFESIDFAKNGFEYLKTKFSRFCVSLYKMNQHLDRGELEIVPYMDFSQEWTDKKLFDYFELTQEEREFINTYIQNWYERDGKSN